MLAKDGDMSTVYPVLRNRRLSFAVIPQSLALPGNRSLIRACGAGGWQVTAPQYYFALIVSAERSAPQSQAIKETLIKSEFPACLPQASLEQATEKSRAFGKLTGSAELVEDRVDGLIQSFL